jgi:hypothetical protein
VQRLLERDRLGAGVAHRQLQAELCADGDRVAGLETVRPQLGARQPDDVAVGQAQRDDDGVAVLSGAVQLPVRDTGESVSR